MRVYRAFRRVENREKINIAQSIPRETRPGRLPMLHNRFQNFFTPPGNARRSQLFVSCRPALYSWVYTYASSVSPTRRFRAPQQLFTNPESAAQLEK